MNLRIKIILFLAPLIILPILTIGIVAFDKLYDTSEVRLTNRVITLLDQISRHALNAESVAKANLKILADHHLVQKFALTEDEEIRYDILLQHTLTLFKTFQKTMPNYLEVKYITLDGFEDAYWSSGEFYNVNESIAGETYFNEIKKSKETDSSFFIKDENTGKYALLVVHKMILRDESVDSFDVKPTLRGYLTVLLNLESLNNEVSHNVIGTSGFLSVIDSTGNIIYAPEKVSGIYKENIGSFLSGGLKSNNDFQKTSFNVNDDVIFSYWRDIFSGMKLVGFLPEKDLINDSYELGKTVFIITVVVIFLVVVFVLIALRYLILNPIYALNSAVVKMKNGNMDIDIQSHKNDEIGVLEKSFFEMSQSLKQSHDILRFSNQRLLLHREHTPLGVIEWNKDFECLDWNPAAQNMFGFTKEEVLGKHVTEMILPRHSRESVDKIWVQLLAQKGGKHSINENITKDGRTILCEWHNTPLIDNDGSVIGVTSLVDDITERLRNEEISRHSQKMDAIGKLTGGIAHDFNNMLGVVLGFSQLIKMRTDKDDVKQNRYCDQIIKAGERARALTSKLLDFSRKSPSLSEVINVNNLLSNMKHMLEKTLTPRIKLTYDFDETIWAVKLDKARLEDAILNMCINSMHAMNDGGSITLVTKNIKFTDVSNVDLIAGDYIVISINDTGTGMSQIVQERIFDPFFTTKGADGTGLGMSQVYGFVQQTGGNVKILSSEGKGSTIELYIPRHIETTVKSLRENKEIRSLDTTLSGNETILIVDDEVGLLDLTKEVLMEQGYTTLKAKSAEQALEILKSNSVDMMLSDVIMPDIDGYQLATKVEKLYPEIKIQMISGFTDNSRKNLDNDTLHQNRLHKPISSEMLLTRVREVLDGKI